ncbi:MAG: cupin domain-containing protein [Nitrospira sp.]|nr:cupin domain-containing protein [Nitrospira sp.]
MDQFIRFESGEGTVILDGEQHAVRDGFAVVIPAGTRPTTWSTAEARLPSKLYGLYSPPEHKDGIVHKTKAEADADHDHHFDGRTS